MSDSWQEKKDKVGSVWISILVWLTLRVHRKLVLLILWPISLIFFWVGRDATRASKNYLARIFGRKARWFQVVKHFYNFAVVSIDRLYFVSGNVKSLNIKFEDHKVIEDVENGGCILMVSHIGSFDALRSMAMYSEKLNLKIVMDHQHSVAIMSVIDGLNTDFAKYIIDSNQPPTALVLELSEQLKNNVAIGLMADRTTSGEARVSCDFLGGRVNLPLGPWHLAAILKVPVVLCFAVYEGRGCYSIHAERFNGDISGSRNQRSLKLASAAQEYSNRMAYYLKENPYNWFNFYDFWDEDLSDAEERTA